MLLRKLLLLAAFSVFFAGAFAECGNGNCEAGETFSNCPSDCPSPLQLELAIDSPIAGAVFLHGDEIFLKAHASVEGKIITGEDYVNAYGFFGTIYLQDDGRHNDDKWKDGFFANSFKVKNTQAAGTYSVFFSAKQGQTYVAKQVKIEIRPELSANLETEKKAYYLGDEIVFQGSLKRHETPLKKNFELDVSDAAKSNYKIPVETDQNGNFSAKLHTSLIDAQGTWTARFSAQDDLNNVGNAEISFQVKNPEDRASLSIILLQEPNLFYRRGSDLLLLAKVFDDTGNEITDANLALETPLGTIVPFERSDKNLFFAAMLIPVKMPYGSQDFTIKATANSSEGLKSGEKTIALNIREINIRTELLSPKSSQALAGDTVVFTVKMYYENGEPLSVKAVPASTNNRAFLLNFEEPGIYTGRYYVSEEDYIINFSIDFDDGQNNKAKFLTQINVSGISIMYYLQKYAYCLLALAAALIACLWLLRKKIKRSFEVKSLKRQAGLLEGIIEKEEKEFIDGKISREEFNKSSAKYSAELSSLRAKIKEMEAKKNAKKN